VSRIPFNVLLFDDFETLDAFGPAEIIGHASQYYELHYFSLSGGEIVSKQQVSVNTISLAEIATGVLLIPGGIGVRRLVTDTSYLETLKKLAEQAQFVLTVCTCSALLGKTGLLDGKAATSNKLAFDWVRETCPGVNWIRKARWVVDGKYYSSSGVSAGMDMTLGFLSDLHGDGLAQEVATRIEYLWNTDKTHDPFADT